MTVSTTSHNQSSLLRRLLRSAYALIFFALLISYNLYNTPLLRIEETNFRNWLAEFETSLSLTSDISHRGYIQVSLPAGGSPHKSGRVNLRVSLSSEAQQSRRFVRLLRLVDQSRLFTAASSGAQDPASSVVIFIDGGSRVFRITADQQSISGNPSAQLFLRLMKVYAEPAADDVSPEMFIAKKHSHE